LREGSWGAYLRLCRIEVIGEENGILSILKLRLKLAVMPYEWIIIVPVCRIPD
jgi:hypothetical protein